MTRIRAAAISTPLVAVWLGVWAIAGPHTAEWGVVTVLALGCIAWTWHWALPGGIAAVWVDARRSVEGTDVC